MKRLLALFFVALMSGFCSAEDKVEYDLNPLCIGTITVDAKQVHCVLDGTPASPKGLMCDPNSFIVTLKETVKLDSCLFVHVVKEDKNAETKATTILDANSASKRGVTSGDR